MERSGDVRGRGVGGTQLAVDAGLGHSVVAGGFRKRTSTAFNNNASAMYGKSLTLLLSLIYDSGYLLNVVAADPHLSWPKRS